MLSIYHPEITHAPIYFPRCGKPPYLRYNHCVDVIRFRGKFYAAWNANRKGNEGVPGQYNFLSVSDDYIHWSAPVKLFAGNLCEPPVYSDRQWQPSFLNWNDQLLFCAWCDTQTHKTYVASSSDGQFWHNREIPADAIPEGTVGFPTNHGLAAKNGSLYFPVSFAPPENFSLCRYAGVLISRDSGRSWHWSSYAQALPFNELGITPEETPFNRPALWEPMVYESAPGKLGMLIRNNTSLIKNPSIRTEHMLLFSESSDGGETWTPARTVELETLCSRCFAERTENGLFLVMNDWPRGIPELYAKDRYHLTLFCGPTGEPDLLLPGPEVQPSGGRAFYPNGFRLDEDLYLGYTYPDYINTSVVHGLPDMSKPFLLPRQSRGGVQFDTQGFCLLSPQATVGLVITNAMADAELITFSFDATTNVRSESPFPILTIGGKTHSGAVLSLEFDPAEDLDRLMLHTFSGQSMELAVQPLHSTVPIAVELWKDRAVFKSGSRTVELAEPLIRKIAFGGLYEPPVYPSDHFPVRDKLRIAAIEIN